ncbi:MAG: fibronectin type III domain-containing protein, partial [Armatimonadetes bacterium]|nr:fibronectin type III domain-containing protein [Armatimonadota bacterium]
SLVEFPTAGFAESRPTPAAGPVKLINIPPGKVQNLVAAGASGVVTLKWDAVKDASGNVVRDLVRYTISRREKGDDAGLTEQLFWVEPDVLQYFDTEVTPGLTYVYRVRAVDFVSEGAWSDEKEATP